MPKISPRFYTVASSPNYTKNKLDIIISLVDWKGQGQQTRYGLTSNYFKNLHDEIKFNMKNNDFTTRIIVRESSFRLPSDSNQSIVMICTGTGIAPFVSFMQEFDYLSKINPNHIINNNLLIFGSKNKKYDFIFEDDLNIYLNRNILKKLYTAFSRDQEKKLYVQDTIKDNKNELINILKNVEEKSIIYICGGVSMGAEVTSILENIFSKEFIKKLETDNRLIKELWG